MDNKIYGYARVSSKDQNEIRQLLALEEYGVAPEDIYIDKQSGKDFNRPGYLELVEKLEPGDTLVVKSIDRLGRNYDEILDQWHKITKEKSAYITVLDMPLLDTKQGKDLTGVLISDIVLQLLSYVAQVEREYIKQRQAEGIAAALERGVRFGAPGKERGREYYRCLRLWLRGKISARAAARRLGIHHKTFMRWAREDTPGEYMDRETTDPAD